MEVIARPLPPPTATRTMGGSTDRRAPTSATCTSRCNQTFRSLFFSGNHLQLVKFFEIRTIGQNLWNQDTAYSACFPNGGGGYPDYSCDPARVWLFFENYWKLLLLWSCKIFIFFWKCLRSIAGKSQLLHWLLRLLLLPGTSREDIKPYMYTMYMTTVL